MSMTTLGSSLFIFLRQKAAFFWKKKRFFYRLITTNLDSAVFNKKRTNNLTSCYVKKKGK